MPEKCSFWLRHDFSLPEPTPSPSMISLADRSSPGEHFCLSFFGLWFKSFKMLTNIATTDKLFANLEALCQKKKKKERDFCNTFLCWLCLPIARGNLCLICLSVEPPGNMISGHLRYLRATFTIGKKEQNVFHPIVFFFFSLLLFGGICFRFDSTLNLSDSRKLSFSPLLQRIFSTFTVLTFLDVLLLLENLAFFHPPPPETRQFLEYTRQCTSFPCWFYTQLWVKQGATQGYQAF